MSARIDSRLPRSAVRVGRLVFAAVLVLGLHAGATALAQQSGVTEVASVDSAGVQGNQESVHAAMTPDGRYVAFASLADNLVPGDTNGVPDTFVRDRLTGTTERVSVDSRGRQGDDASGVTGVRSLPAISADGRFVAFASQATNLVRGDRNNAPDVFVRDRLTGTTERVSVSSSGAEALGFSTSPAISADGRLVAFESDATNFGDPAEPFPRRHIYVHDWLTGTTERTSEDSAGAPGDSDSSFAAISGDGRLVAFVSTAGNLVPGGPGPGDPPSFFQVYVHDRETGTTLRISEDAAGNPGDFDSFMPALSGDGRFVAFESNATNLVAGDTSPVRDIYVADRQAGTLERVTTGPDGTEANESSFEPAISAEGRFVAFQSFASNLVPGDDQGIDVFVHDRQTGTTEKVSVSSTGDGGNAASELPALSDDGQVVAFESNASNLVPGDANTGTDVFVHDRRSADLALALADAPDPVSRGGALTYTLDVSNHGPGVAFAVLLTDQLPESVRLVSAISAAGGCSEANGLVACELGDLAIGASATVTIVAMPRKAGTIATTARVRSVSPDPEPANNTATAMTVVTR